MYDDITYDFLGDLHHFSFLTDPDTQKKRVHWREILEIETIPDLDQQWDELFMGPYCQRVDEWFRRGPVSDVIMGIIGGVGAAASIAGAVYTRRALRMQEAEARRAGQDIEQGQPTTNSSGPGIELPQVRRPEPVALPGESQSSNPIDTAHGSTDSFHTAQE